MKEILNLTPHDINIYVNGKEILTIKPYGIIPRCEQKETTLCEINGIPITKQVFVHVYCLPEQEHGVFLIVSKLVASAFPYREDLLIPGPIVRDTDGKPIGCNGLSKI